MSEGKKREKSFRAVNEVALLLNLLFSVPSGNIIMPAVHWSDVRRSAVTLNVSEAVKRSEAGSRGSSHCDDI